MDRMNWWAIAAVTSILAAFLLAVVGVSVQLMVAILTVTVVTSVFSVRE